MTLASTSQMLDARTRRWATDLAGTLGIPADLLPELVEAGQVIGQTDDGTPIIATASHDTAAAVVGCPVEGPGDWAFLSSGTWSILGMELDQPRLGPEALAAGLSNEAGVAGTTRLLRNIMGLWLLQECRRQWAAAGPEKDQTWDELVRQAGEARPFSAVLDPDDETFLAPGDMLGRIAGFCRRTGQPVPDSVGQFVRVIFESLAVKTRWVLERLESVAGRRARVIHLVGGGSSNRLLCQWTADATGRVVVAGPAEATAAGNVLTQAVGVGAIDSFAHARQVLRQSIELDEYEPLPSAEWDGAYEGLCSLLQA
jgi:rhamnulokinase